jgi:hypothetical protein
MIAGALVEVRQLSSLSSLTGGDIWWHLRTGTWMLEHHAVPRQALSTQIGKPTWVDPGWAFDALTATLYRISGLRAFPFMLMLLRVLLAALTFFLAGGRRYLWPAVIISAWAQFVLAGLPASPTFCSALLFGTEVGLLLESRRSRSDRPLFLLPTLFLIWANLDVQFVYGLLLLGIFLIAHTIETGLGRVFREFAADRRLSARAILAIALAFAATLINPYFAAPYGVFFDRVTSAANAFLPDYHAPVFKQSQDYLLLLLTMAAFLALGRRRSRDVFAITTLVACSVASFHAQRDLWLVAIAATAVLGDALRPAKSIEAADSAASRITFLESPFTFQRVAPLAASFAVVIGVALALLPKQPVALMAAAGKTYPTAASDFIRQRQLPAPLFNAYEWGGFLLWYLPEYAVATDSRPRLYSADDIILYSKAMNADLPYTADPAFAAARTLILPRHSLMGEALRDLPAFQVAFSDDVAVVLVKNES